MRFQPDMRVVLLAVRLTCTCECLPLRRAHFHIANEEYSRGALFGIPTPLFRGLGLGRIGRGMDAEYIMVNSSADHQARLVGVPGCSESDSEIQKLQER